MIKLGDKVKGAKEDGQDLVGRVISIDPDCSLGLYYKIETPSVDKA